MTSRGNPSVKAAVVVLFKKPLRVIEFMAGDYRDGDDRASTGCEPRERPGVPGMQPRKKLERLRLTTLKSF